MGEQKKTIPIESDLPHTAEQRKSTFRTLHNVSFQLLFVLTEHCALPTEVCLNIVN